MAKADIPAADDGQMTVIEHLTELRSRLIKSALAIAVGAVVGWWLYPDILQFILDPYCETINDPECTLRVDEPLESLSTRMMVSGYVGIGLAVPVWLWQAWRFVSPGLYPHERRHGITFVALGVVLFTLGVTLAFWTMPRALEFLIDIGGPDPNGYGLFDMCGNVSEWVSDYYYIDYYKRSPYLNPHCTEQGNLKVIRGGGWHSGRMCSSVTARNGLREYWVDFCVGFRCVKPSQP